MEAAPAKRRRLLSPVVTGRRITAQYVRLDAVRVCVGCGTAMEKRAYPMVCPACRRGIILGEDGEPLKSCMRHRTFHYVHALWRPEVFRFSTRCPPDSSMHLRNNVSHVADYLAPLVRHPALFRCRFLQPRSSHAVRWRADTCQAQREPPAQASSGEILDAALRRGTLPAAPLHAPARLAPLHGAAFPYQHPRPPQAPPSPSCATCCARGPDSPRRSRQLWEGWRALLP